MAMLPSINEEAKDLWSQIFSRSAAEPNATLYKADFQSQTEMEESFSEAMLEAGWSLQEIEERISITRHHAAIPNENSPGVGPGLEATLRLLADRISQEMSALGISKHRKIEFAIDPKPGVSAELINVIMTDQAIINVSSFFFRWCGLIARAYIRTLVSDLSYWTGPQTSKKDDLICLLRQRDIALYWGRIYLSFSASGTHAFVPFKPSTREEVLLMEQVAWSMEYFTISHEYGHHIFDHRSIDADPIEQEFEADGFALRICDRLTMEPLKMIENPYIKTGAGFILMLKALEILSTIDGKNKNITSNTHPPTSERIKRIMYRNILQPKQFEIDQDFNKAVIRIMETVSDFLDQYLRHGGRDLIRSIKYAE